MPNDLEITDITFEGGDLSRPRYPSLINAFRAPAGVQFEPGIQIIHGERDLTFLLGIDPSSEAVFESDASGLPVVESIVSPSGSGIAGLVERSLLDSRTCQLTWRPGEAESRLTALRVRCSPTLRGATDPERVDGGVYLMLLDRPEWLPEEHPAVDPGLPVPHTIKILGTDGHKRPVYDLYLRAALDSLPTDLALEPTFRVREGHAVDFSMLFAPDVDLRFLPSADDFGQVAVEDFPSGRPPQLVDAAREDAGKECRLKWVQATGRDLCTSSSEERGEGHCLAGQVTSFMLVAFVGPGSFFDVEERDKRRLVDPTVIQPPSCTSSGICITP